MEADGHLQCYLCPGNQRAQGDVNPKYDSTFVFVNDYSAVRENQAHYDSTETNGCESDNRCGRCGPQLTTSTALESRLLKAESTTGKCYVITFSPEHNLTLADMPPQSILPVIETWTKIYTSHIDPLSSLSRATKPTTLPPSAPNGNIVDEPAQQYRYMQIFENKGSAMGCSNPHPHGQIWTTTSLPEEPGIELLNLSQYRREHNGAHLLEDYAKLESDKGERTVYENGSFWAGVPWWGTWPFEIMIVAKSHKRALVDFSAEEKRDLSEVIAEITRRYDNLFETSFPYSKS